MADSGDGVGVSDDLEDAHGAAHGDSLRACMGRMDEAEPFRGSAGGVALGLVIGVYCNGDTCWCTLDGVKGPSCKVPADTCDVFPPEIIDFPECCG
jgi:hypothetical protein